MTSLLSLLSLWLLVREEEEEEEDLEECLEPPVISEEARLDLEREMCEMTVGGEGGGNDAASDARRESSRLLLA